MNELVAATKFLSLPVMCRLRAVSLSAQGESRETIRTSERVLVRFPQLSLSGKRDCS